MRKTSYSLCLAVCFILIWGTDVVKGQQNTRQASPAPAAYSFDGTKGFFQPQYEDGLEASLRSNMETLVKAPGFSGAALDNDIVNLPYKDIVVPIGAQERLTIEDIRLDGQVEVSTDQFRESVSESGLSIQGSWYPASNIVIGDVEKRVGNYVQHVRIYPVQVSANGDRLRKVKSVSWTLGKSIDRSARVSTGSGLRTYSSNSQLASGSWVKVAITGNGVYRIDQNDFPNFGIDPASVDPRTIRIHGNGGGMLPQIAGEHPYDDLVENPIWVSGQADGSFDAGDYLLFYGQGPHQWDYNDSLLMWTHSYNLYSDTTYYYLTFGGAQGMRVSDISSAQSTNYTPTYTDALSFYEKDDYNPLGSGRVWLGESFDLTTTRGYDFPLTGLRAGTDVNVTARLGGRSNVTQSFTIRENGATVSTVNVPTTNTSIYGNYYYRTGYSTFDIPASQLADGNLNLEFTYSKPATSSIGYMDYIEVRHRRTLSASSEPGFTFYAREGVGPGQVFDYNINGAGSYRLWDISDPVAPREINAQNNGGTMSFGVECDSIKTFYAFSDNAHRSPVSYQTIGNQNLHGLEQAEYLIISHPNFFSAANTLAAFHRSYYNRSVHVVNVYQIFEEFSCGAQDPTAIRDFIKMFYDRGQANSSTLPKYVLMMGDGSYDYKNRISTNLTNFVPTYQSRKSQRPTESYVSDDYYGFLDDGEGFWGEKAGLEGGAYDILFMGEGDDIIQTHGLDVAIGRMPVNTAAEAEGVVAKIVNYISTPNGFGPWRNRVLLVADHKDEDGQIHISQADSYTQDIQGQQPCMNIDKLYMDNYLLENTASGSRFPDGKDALIQGLNDGALLVNYTGHGGEIGWSNASILDISDINNLDNGNRLAAYITATCEFGRWDDPARKAGAEVMFLRNNGGSIAMFTTVRVVYSGQNYYLNQRFYDHVFDRDANNDPLTMGEIFRRTKNDSWLGGINNRNFSLMGDPAMPLAFPTLSAEVTEINGMAIVDTIPDTLSALSLVTIEGEIKDQNGNFMSSYNGDLFATVYDKPNQFTTRRSPFSFFWQKNRVFNGEATVENGRFSFQFVVPIDISYDDGYGKISFYVESTGQDGSGCRDNVYIGGSDAATIIDETPPEMEVFMNDEKFVDGGMVGPDPIMIASIYDENGLNTVGTGIGHELTAILDGDENNVIVLNDFYSALKDSYQEGRIEFPFTELADGQHNLEVKVWDVANNSATREVSFVVADNANIALGHVLNYPNPFTTNTKFYIEHNLNGRPLSVQVKIFTVAGRLVKTLDDSFFADGNIYCDLDWDGLDEYGDAIGRGAYVYQVLLKDESTGEKVSTFEKLVVLR